MAQVNELKILISAEVDRYVKALQDAENKTKGFGNSAKNALGEIGTGLGFNAATVGIAGVTAAIVAAGAAAIKASSDFEQYKVSFEVMTGSAEKGLALLNQLRDFANVTPFTTDDLAQASKVLLQFGVNLEEVMPTLSVLGDVSGGNSEKLNSLVLAFGQMSSAGRLMGQDLLQMINAGFNPLQEISKRTGKSMAELKSEMEKGAISSGMVKQAFIDATAEGGRFNNMMQKQSETTAGTFSTLVDTWGKVAVSIGDTLAPAVKTLIALMSILGQKTYEAGVNFQLMVKTSQADKALQNVEMLRKLSKNGTTNDEAAFKYKQELVKANNLVDEINKLSSPAKTDIDISKINTKTSSTKTNTKKGSAAVNIDLRTLKYDNYAKDFAQKLKETQAQIDAETAMSEKELSVKSELRKQGLLDTERDFRDELALRVDFEKKKLDIINSVEKDTKAALSSIEEKRKSDILSITGGNAPNKSQAIAAINESAKTQIAAIQKLSVEKEKALLQANDRELAAKRKLSDDLRKADDDDSRRQLQLTKNQNANDISMQEQELANRIKAIHYQSIDEKLQIELDYIEKKKNLDIGQMNAEIEINHLKGVELEAMNERKHQVEEEARIKSLNAEQAANEARIQQARDLYSQLGDISGNFLELMLSHELTKAKIAEMGQSALKQVLIGGLKAMFKEEQALKLQGALMDSYTAASKGWASGWALPFPANVIAAPTLAIAAAAFPLAQASLIAAANYREFGGDVRAGQAYIVGEKRPEVFVPDRNGTILPNTNQLSSGGQNMQPVLIAQTFNIKAFDAKDVKQYLAENRSMIQNMVADGIKNNSNQLRMAVKNA